MAGCVSPSEPVWANKAFQEILGRIFVIDQLKQDSASLERVGIGEARGEYRSWTWISISSHLCRRWTSLPMGYWLAIFIRELPVHSLPVTPTILSSSLLIWVKLFDKNNNWESYVLQIFFPIWRLSFLWYTFCHVKLCVYVSKCINIFLWLLGLRSRFERPSSVQKYKCLLMFVLWFYGCIFLYLSILFLWNLFWFLSCL